jgi:hypothetical protein
MLALLTKPRAEARENYRPAKPKRLTPWTALAVEAALLRSKVMNLPVRP